MFCLLSTEIFSAPSNNATVALGGGSVEFRCNGRGTSVYWKINDAEAVFAHKTPPYISIHQIGHYSNNTVTITLEINVAYTEANNTRIRCQTEQLPPDPSIPDENSTTVTLTIAGTRTL